MNSEYSEGTAQFRLTRFREFGEFGGVNPSIEVSTTFTVLEPETLQEIFEGQRGPAQGCYLYGRSFNPTVRVLGRYLAALEGTEAAYACSSGMAAISSTILGLCGQGDHIISSGSVYGGTFSFLKDFLAVKCGITTSFVAINDLGAVEASITSKTKVIYTESMSNPTLVPADLRRLADLAHARGIKLVVDNTFTPFIISPARHGADIVLHSMTKFMSGASDIVAGAVCGPASFIASLMDLHTGPLMLLGPTMDPKVASELLLRLPHLPLRMQEHSRRAMHMAIGLSKLGAKVTYPGLPSNPDHALAKSLIDESFGYGGLLGIEFDSADVAQAFMQRLQNKHAFGLIAVSLGYADTLMSLSASSTSSELTEEERAAAGISGGYVRMSIGITGTLSQRWEQLRESFEFVKRVGSHAKYKAVRVRRMADGTISSLVSWPSDGSLDTLPAVRTVEEGEARLYGGAGGKEGEAVLLNDPLALSSGMSVEASNGVPSDNMTIDPALAAEAPRRQRSLLHGCGIEAVEEILYELRPSTASSLLK